MRSEDKANAEAIRQIAGCLQDIIILCAFWVLFLWWYLP